MEKSEKKQPMIRIRGANENNLKSVDLDIPRNLLCQTVFRTDGETGCGEYRRTSAGDFHRPEINQPQSEIYGGNGDRNL